MRNAVLYVDTILCRHDRSIGCGLLQPRFLESEGHDRCNRTFLLLPVQLARGLGLWAVGKMPPLKRFFMRHAMGLTGDLPDIVKENR